MEYTLVLIKPHAVAEGISDQIISELSERSGGTIIEQKKFIASRELVEKHYAEHREKEFYPWIVADMISGPLVALVFSGQGIIEKIRMIAGKTDPAMADVDTIRGKYGKDSQLVANREKRGLRNCIHTSDRPESAYREISIWFPGLIEKLTGNLLHEALDTIFDQSKIKHSGCYIVSHSLVDHTNPLKRRTIATDQERNRNRLKEERKKENKQ